MKFKIEDEFIRNLGNIDLDKIETEFLTFMRPIMEGTKDMNLWQISDCESFAIYMAIRSLRPKKVVETGIGSGKSSLSILSALDEGELISIDPLIAYGDPPRSDFGFLVPEELKRKWRIIKGTSREILPVILESIKFIDVFIHDSEHSYGNVKFELIEAYNHIVKGLILVDNYDWTTAPLDFGKEFKLQLVKVCADMCAFFINKH